MPGSVWLCDERDARRKSFVAGENIFVSGHGLPAATLHDFYPDDQNAPEKRSIIARLCTDRHGALPPTLLISYAGLAEHQGNAAPTIDAAIDSFEERRDAVRVNAANGRQILFDYSLPIPVTKAGPQSRLFSCDANGRFQPGVERGTADIGIALHNFAAGCVRLFVVPRQNGWRAGDLLEPARTLEGTPAVTTIRHDGAAHRVVAIASSADLPPGSYQFIARVFPPGWYEADEPVLLRTDVVSDYRFASLVVRMPYNRRFGYANGITLTPQIAGRPLAHRPYCRFVNGFPKRTDVYAALDPDALPQGLVSQRAAIYGIAHKTASQWAASNALTGISGPNMTSAVKIVPIVPGCVNWNTALVYDPPPEGGVITVRYGDSAEGAVREPFSPKRVQPLPANCEG